MKAISRFVLVVLLLVLVPLISKPQDTLQKTDNQLLKSEPGLSLFSIQKSFENYWKGFQMADGYYIQGLDTIKAYGYKQFKRWEWFWQPRVNPSTGEFPTVNAADIRLKMAQTAPTDEVFSNWTSLGPTSSLGGYAGLGRINCIGFRAGDTNTFYVGSPSGGLWKTTDCGLNWTPLTDFNAVLGVSDVIVLPGLSPATDTLYIATGDRDLGSLWALPSGQPADNSSIGVLKSTDGGATWQATGLSFAAAQNETTNRILIDPLDHQKLYAASSAGFYKSVNGGADWSLTSGLDFVDVELNPGNSQMLVASTRTGGEVWLSVDNGVGWMQTLDVVGGYRTELAVSAADPNRVYAVVVNYNNGLKGVWRSLNGGFGFTNIYAEPNTGNSNKNLLHGNCNPGAIVGGQGHYDLAIAAHPENADILYIGGINTWKSTNGGASFSIVNHWNSTCTSTVQIVHADKHCLAFQDGSLALFEGNDGGIYKSLNDGIAWQDLSNNLVISQFYRISTAQTHTSEVLGGLQDNGTKLVQSGAWSDIMGADGMDCGIDYTTNQVQYCTKQNGALYRTTNHWASNTYISGSLGTGAWVTPLVIDPVANNTIYFAPGAKITKSLNRGTTWTTIGSFSGNKITSIDVAPSNPLHILTSNGTTLNRTTTGNSPWTVVSDSLPTATSSITSITFSQTDANRIWIGMGGYNSDCVFETTNGGATWHNISAGLPQVPVMDIVQNKQNTAETELFVATDVGVFRKIDTCSWTPYVNLLPNVVINDLEIYYNSSNPTLSKLRAATYGRGIWESALPPLPVIPIVAAFSATNVTPNTNDTVTFTDLSTGNPTSWQWTITPDTYSFAAGSGNTSQNPEVIFSTPGIYTISLLAENLNGSDIEIKTKYILSNYPAYCQASGGTTNTIYEYIYGVTCGSINNTPTGSSQYADYTTLSTTVTPGDTVNVSITLKNSNNQDDISIWVDWNQDKDFEDAGELMVCAFNFGASNQFTYSASFVVPSGALTGVTRMRIRLKYDGSDCGSPCGQTTLGEVEDYSLSVETSKLLNLTLFPEALFNGTDLNASRNGTTNQFPAGIADQITIELRDASSPHAVIWTSPPVEMDTLGVASLEIPSTYSGNYYLSVHHRNHIETWSESAISFAGNVISYNFTDAASKAFMSNQKQLATGVYGLYAGDVNQDGVVNQSDMDAIAVVISAFLLGYVSADVNGDGIADALDMIITDNNASLIVTKKQP